MAKIGRPVSWPSPKTALAARLHEILPHEGLARLAQNFFEGISKETVSRYLSGDSEPSVSQILNLCKKWQINPLYVIFGLGHYSDEVYGLDSPELLRPEPQGALKIASLSEIRALNSGDIDPHAWPVRGCAAADDSHGTRVPDTDDFDDPINPPAGLMAVPVTGDSMSPVVLDGQYVLIDQEREGHEVDGEIAVISILEPEADDDRAESMTGTFVKRCYDGGNGLYYFTSVNEYSPFSAWTDHCRVWPVIGVWFGGKGKPPDNQ